MGVNGGGRCSGLHPGALEIGILRLTMEFPWATNAHVCTITPYYPEAIVIASITKHQFQFFF